MFKEKISKLWSTYEKYRHHNGWDWFLFAELMYLQLFAVYGFYLTFSAKFATVAFAYVLAYLAILGTNAGAHRYWTHRGFKAKKSLQMFMMFCFTLAFHRSLRTWVRDHKIHHKYSDTVADPHNSHRGFFFAHIGWVFMPKSPELLKAEKEVDISDLEKDPIVSFQYKYYEPFALTISLFLPTLIPVFFWNESLIHAYHIAVVLRTFTSSHLTWSVNSITHMFGYKPYDVTLKPTQNPIVSFFVLGEGWHNYHHAFPWDYKTEEFGSFSSYFFNHSTAFIDLCAKLGLAYDLKEATPALVDRRRTAKGDKSELMSKNL